ncbi:DsrE family protein [uncultured Ruegeria sp.]|uniref:DsrE family protein n=1 Tax=uncultured Ruegeria sp. TaxID=259304 RepID=UPI002608E89D|nr:DsrE family protein [uncultured Ruegeria sp.]
MADSNKLVILVTKGIDHELSSVAFTIACGGITSGQEVSIFLTSSGIDLVRKGGASMTRVDPLDSLANLMADFQARGGTIWACLPCVKARGYDQDDLIDGVIITGASKLHEQLINGASSLSF